MASKPPQRVPPFYVYPDMAYDQSAVLECFPQWAFDDQAAEVSAIRLLRRHPARVAEPAKAEMFVLPVLPYVSAAAGTCQGTTHEERMLQVATALRHEPYFLRRGGADHLLVTNTFRVRTFGPWLKTLLANATVAWFEQPHVHGAKGGGGAVLYSLAFWRCTVVIPYLANPFCAQQREVMLPRGADETGGAAGSGATAIGGDGGDGSWRRRRNRGDERPAGSLFFQGSWAAAAYLRRHFSQLQGMPGAHVRDVPRGCNGTTETTLEVVHACVASRAAGSRLRTARGMLTHQYCLVPRGDTPSSGRLFAALACRCVPVVLSNKLQPHLPYADVAKYDEWTLRVPEGEFIHNARQALERAMSRSRAQLGRMREAMDAAATELLFDAPDSRAAHNLLLEWRRQCAPSSGGPDTGV